MYARKKVIVLPSDPSDSTLERAILATAETDMERSALSKDLLLVEAALASDSIIISRDDKVRELLHRAANRVKTLRKIMWINPVHYDVVRLLQKGVVSALPKLGE